ncbi:p53-induced death domain-containing protein 1 isoform X1 [Lepisosteus oculatus]|uniref:p53-induced death domain-containing protein 1 isoform X1 n=1 Tax=Lepisosteus oculatus TaxID=7918 RepID=UPI0035F53016
MDHSTQSREGSEEQRGERRHTAGLIKRREGSEEQRGERRHTAGLEESREELEEQRGERRHTAGLEESRERLEEQREEGRHTGGLIKRREGSEEQRGERRHKAGLEESREGLEEQRGERRHTTGLEESREGSEEQRGERRHTAELEENREGSEEQRGERRHTTGLEESREGSEEQRGERRHTAGLEESREGSEEQRGERRHKAGLEESREGLEEQRGERRHTTGLEESREGLEEQRGERRHKAGLEESREGLEEQRGERRHTTGLEESREGLEEQRGERRHTTGLEESREGLEEQRGERRHTTGLEESREGLEEQRGERRHTTGLEESREGLEEQRGERRHTTGLEESREGLEEQRGERRHTTGLEESREGLEEQRGERRHKAGLEESREGLEEQRGERRHTTGLEESREGLEEQRGERRHTTGLEESRDGSEEQRGERRHTARLEESKEGSEEERGERRHTAWLEENREGSEEQRGERRHTGGLEESREELEEQRGERRHTAGLIKRKEGSEEQRGERRHTAGLEESREGSEEQTGERRHTAGLEESRDGSEEQRGERRHTARLEESREGSEEQRGERRHTSRLEESREGYEEQTGERRHTAGLIKRSEGSSEEHQGAEEGRAIEEVQPLGPGPSRQTAGDTQRVGSRGAGSQGPAWQQEGGDGVSAHPCLSAPSSLCAAPPPPLAALLADTRLTLDVFPRGAVLLCGLWEALQGAVSRVEFLRLGSEEQEGLDRALTVIGQLSRLRSLSIRGGCVRDKLGSPQPGQLSSLPDSLGSLCLLTHLDLSFNQLASLPACLRALPRLSHLLLGRNALSSLPDWLGALRSLSSLSLMGNRLTAVPPSLGQLGALQSLDLSHNQLEALPPEVGALERLNHLELSCNRLTELPDTLGSVLSLRRLVLHSNNLHSVPSCLLLRPDLELDLRNNPLGRPPTPASPPSSSVQSESVKLPELHLGPNQHSFSVCQEGCHVFLPGGAELVFPRDAVSMVTVQWAERRPHRKWVWLEDHDILLSRALELRPHGTAFQKPVEVCLPFSRPPHAPGREVLIRRFDGSTWTQLHTTTRRGSRGAQTDRHRARVACCTVSQFSWFLVLSCLLEDSCSVPPQGALLLSSVDPRIKVTFTPRSTLQTRMVKLQVLKVGLSELRELTGDPQASCSPLVRLSQSTLDTFLLPVRVQIPLPPEVTGHSLDRSCLYLLHGDPASRTWTDVTAQVGLQLTQLYALFSISHFSWYWLWYTTRRCVGGVVRRVYERLRMFRVQFLVLQRKSDPEQVLLQCLPSQKVESTLQSLSELYDGPRPSDLCELLEGEQFFAGFERGLEISSERPDCVGGRLSFVFYSHLKNHKEVYICPSQDQQEPVRGQVSFYRGEVPSSVPQDAAQKRKGPDSQWLATLPLRLPSKQCTEDESLLPPLNLGDPESGYLTEANLLAISLRISQDWRTIGINLGLSYQQLDRIQYRHRDDLGALVLAMLFQWARSEGAGPGAVPRLVAAMKESGREDVAAEIEDIVRLGTRKYHDSLRRVGLQAGQ